MQVKTPNMTPELLSKFQELLGEPVAHDDGNALFSDVEQLDQRRMGELARQHGSIIEAIIHGEGALVAMRDGRTYKVGANGQWVRVDAEEQEGGS